jgi:AraC-like DNA-binding protein
MFIGQEAYKPSWVKRAVTWQCHRQHTQSLPIAQQEEVQLSRGKASWISVWACGRDLLISRMVSTVRKVVRVVPNHEWIAVLISDNPKSEYVVNGHVAKERDLFVSTTGNGYSSIGENRSGFAIGLKRDRLTNTCAALCGVRCEESYLTDVVISLSSNEHSRLLGSLDSVLEHSFNQPVEKGRYRISAVLENDLYDQIARLLLPSLAGPRRPSMPATKALEVVARATAVAKEPDVPVSVADMCMAAGVGEAWLHKCFLEICGTSPARYLLLRRLFAARETLLDVENPPPSVKDVAISLGFREGGRFAQRYRVMFGEKPSETLQRTRCNAQFPQQTQLGLETP